jgi:serine/threonine-protein kinase
MIGKSVLHYKILEKLGEGGMGIVYLAEDTKLQREVAIKFLPSHIATKSDEHKRFEIEARAAAALNHPNIATIYAIEETDDQMFIVMEYINGLELKEKLKSGPLDRDEAKHIALQIARGLQAAHEKNIIHRDIKSTNIMITSKGQVKIMDFGLAKVRGGVELTKEQSTIGTAAYMSPEQARGEQIDQRADIWSFGVVLYEMLSGLLPFPGDYEQAVIYSILNTEPEFPAQIPVTLKQVLENSLAKKPGKRYQHADELISDLQNSQPAVNSARRKSASDGKSLLKRAYLLSFIAFVILAIAVIAYFVPFSAKDETIDSIAVLPLKNLSGDPTQEYFADGMTEALILDLSKIQTLKIISRTSVMRYKQTTKSLPEIADELNVKAVIEGSVIRAGDQVRITAQLIEAGTERHLWADSYDRSIADVLMLQREIALSIAERIKVVLSPEEEKRLAVADSVDPEAHENYLKGLHHLRKDTETGILQGIQYYNQSIELSPAYALAHAGLADAYQRLTGNGYISAQEGYPKALASVQRALELEPELNEAHLALARIKFVLEWDWEGAEREFLKVLKQNPNSARGHERFAIFLTMMGRFEESTKHILRARELDPLSDWINNNVGWIYYLQRKYDDSLIEYQNTLEMFPNFSMSHRELAAVYALTGKPEQAIKSAITAVNLSNNDLTNIAYLGMIYALTGESDKARKIITQMQERSKIKAIPLFEMGMAFHALGDNDMAFHYLEQSLNDKSSWTFQIKVDPVSDKLRSDPRYESLLRKMGLEP